MNNIDPRPEATKKQILSRYADLKFVAVPAPTDTHRNRRRGPRKSNRKTRTIL